MAAIDDKLKKKLVFATHNLAGFIPDLAALRIRVFREFPYLYEGTTDYEREYLHTDIQAPNAIIVVAPAPKAS